MIAVVMGVKNCGEAAVEGCQPIEHRLGFRRIDHGGLLTSAID
jgi:hypothetical protein